MKSHVWVTLAIAAGTATKQFASWLYRTTVVQGCWWCPWSPSAGPVNYDVSDMYAGKPHPHGVPNAAEGKRIVAAPVAKDGRKGLFGLLQVRCMSCVEQHQPEVLEQPAELLARLLDPLCA